MGTGVKVGVSVGDGVVVGVAVAVWLGCTVAEGKVVGAGVAVNGVVVQPAPINSMRMQVIKTIAPEGRSNMVKPLLSTMTHIPQYRR